MLCVPLLYACSSACSACSSCSPSPLSSQQGHVPRQTNSLTPCPKLVRIRCTLQYSHAHRTFVESTRDEVELVRVVNASPGRMEVPRDRSATPHSVHSLRTTPRALVRGRGSPREPRPTPATTPKPPKAPKSVSGEASVLVKRAGRGGAVWPAV